MNTTIDPSFDPTSIVVPNFDPNNIDGNIDGNQINNEQIDPEVVHVQELPSSNFIGRIWSVCSGIGSLVLSPIHALCNLISRISHKIFSSQPSTPSTTPLNLDAPISFDDNHLPEINEEQLGIINSLVSRNLAGSKGANPPAIEPQINSHPGDENPNPNDPNEVPSSPLTNTEVTAPNLPNSEITDADLDQLFRDEEPFDLGEILPDELQVPADNPPPPAPSGPTLVQIPAQGSCLFMAIAVGLKKLYPNDEKINQILKWDYDAGFLGDDLRADEDAANLRIPALHLRSLATATIIQELNYLKEWADGLNILENNNNEIEGPDEDKIENPDENKIEGSNILENNGNEKSIF